MSIHIAETVACPGCNRKLLAPVEPVAAVRCPKCGHVWNIAGKAELNDTFMDCSVTTGPLDVNAYQEQERVYVNALAAAICVELNRRGAQVGDAEIKSYIELRFLALSF